MSLLQPDPIFRGINSTATRKALKSVLDDSGDLSTFLLPCVGQFTAAEALVDFGVKPTQIITSDISLFSSVLGYLCDPTKDLNDLGFKSLSPELDKLLYGHPTPLSVEYQAAKILYAIKWGQFDVSKDFTRWQRIEFESQRNKVMDTYAQVMLKLREKLLGTSYQQKDALEHMSDYLNDSTALIWYHPPWYKNGYAKMFKAAALYSWEEPSIPELDLAKTYDFFNILKEADSLTLCHITEDAKNKGGFEGWHTVLVDRKSNGKREFLLSSRTPKQSIPVRNKIKPLPSKVFPVYDDHPLTPDSVVELKRVAYDVAMYYYDLFIKGLGMPKAEAYYLFVIDNQVAGVTGLHMQHWLVKRKPSLEDVFSITMQSEAYPRIGELFSRLLTSKPNADYIVKELYPSVSLGAPMTYYQTSFISKSPSIMKVRGFMKLAKRDELPDGRFKLVYRCNLVPNTLQEIFNVWLKKQQSAN